MASNGMIHMIKGVLVPPEKTVMELLKERPDMAVFTTVLERTKLDKMLMDETKHFTILAPTDSAFEKLDPQLRKKIKEGRGCASSKLICFTFFKINTHECCNFTLIKQT